MKFKQIFKLSENVDMDDDGRRYTTKSLKELFFEVITEPMHSNEEKTCRSAYKSMMNRFLVNNSNNTTTGRTRPAITLRKNIIGWK